MGIGVKSISSSANLLLILNMKKLSKPATAPSSFLHAVLGTPLVESSDVEKPRPDLDDYYPLQSDAGDLVVIEVENSFPDDSDEPLDVRLVRRDNGEVIATGIYDLSASDFYFSDISPSEKYFNRQEVIDIGNSLVSKFGV